uniref:TBC-domain-containing protein n=2 Tax=Mesocestoides corti TaxID=53468 RepID=A0A5K3ENP6_MESCO
MSCDETPHLPRPHGFQTSPGGGGGGGGGPLGSSLQLADSVASRPTNDMENGESAARTSSTERRLSEPKPPALSPTPQSKETIVAPARGRPLVPTGGHATVAVKDETNIERLRKDAERLEAAIRNIRSRKSELSDWFFDQMLVAQVASDDGNLAGRTMPAQSSGADIKRSYKKRNAELTQKLAELEGRLSDTRLVISHLEGQSLPTDPDAVRAYISQILAENRRKGGGSATAPSPHVKLPARPADTDDTDTSVSLTAPTPLATTAETPAVTEQPPQQSHHSSPRSGTALPPQSAVNATDIANAVPLNLTASEASESLSPPAKSRTLPQESDISKEAVAHALPVDATNSARVTRLRSALPPIGTQEERPSSGHSDPVTSTNFFGTSPPPPPQLPLKAPSSSKKPRNSARRAFSRLVKPFGRRSGSAFPSPPLKKSASEEHMLPAAAAFSPLNDGTYKLYKVPSASNARMLSPNAGLHLSGAVSTTSRSKKSIKLGNGGPVDHSFQLEPGASSKKSHAGSVSSGVAGRQSRNQQAESTATSGGSESCPPCNVGVGSSVNDEAVGIINVLDVLCGGGIGGLGVARSSVGNPVTSSGGGSTHSGGAAAPMSANGATAGPSSSVFLSASSTTPPPAYNVAMALVMLHQRSQALLEAHAEAQQKLISELREELTNLRQDLMETRNMVNTITVEVEALRRDMQTKEDVQSHTLSNAIARLEQLDASAEKLRQNVQQDLISIRNEQKHALEPLKYQLATETRDLRDMFTTLSNKVTIMEKCERLSNLDRDQPQALRLIANTMTNLVVSLFAFITALIQILIRFLNAGATVTNNRVSAIVLNVCILVFLLVIFLAEPLFRWWNRTDAIYPSSPAFQPPR